jgi:hypothetical protein
MRGGTCLARPTGVVPLDTAATAAAALSWRLGGFGQLVNPHAAGQIRPAAVHGAPRCPSCVQYGDARSVRHGLVASGGSWDIRVHPLMRGLAASGARQWQVCDIFLH